MTRQILINIILLLSFWISGFASGGGFYHNNLVPSWIVTISLIGVFVSGMFLGVKQYLKNEDDKFADALLKFSQDYLKSGIARNLSYEEFEKKYIKDRK